MATDTTGASSSVSFKVQLVDNTAPVINVPGPITRTAASGRAYALIAPNVTVTEAGPYTLTGWPADNFFQLGTTIVTWTAQDEAGNVGTATQTVTLLASAESVGGGTLGALSGKPAPGLSDQYRKFIDLQVNANGEVAFVSELASGIKAIFSNGGLGAAAAPVLIARQGDVVGGVKMGVFAKFSLQNDGAIYFVASTPATGNSQDARPVLWKRSPNSNPQVELNGNGGAIPGLDNQHVLQSFVVDLCEGGGAAVLQMDIAKLPAAEKNLATGVLVRKPTGWVLLAREGGNMTPGPGTYQRFDTTQVASSAGGNAGFITGDGIYATSAGNPIRTGAIGITSVPGSSGDIFKGFTDLAVGPRSTNNLVFRGTWTGQPVPIAPKGNFDGLFTNSANGTLNRVAAKGDYAFGSVYRTFNTQFFMDSNGGVLFAAQTGSQIVTSTDSARGVLFKPAAEPARMLIQENATAPGNIGTVEEISDFSMSPNGWIVVKGRLALGSGTVSANDQVLWAAPPGGKLTVRAREGMAFEKSPGVLGLITDFTLTGARNVINDTGRVSVVISLLDGSQAAVVINP